MGGAGEHHKLGGYPPPVQGPVELLPLSEGDPEVVGPVDHLSGGGDVGDAVDGRVSLVGLVVLPELAVHVGRQVVLDVRGSGHADEVRQARPHAGGFEPVRAGDGEGGHVPPVAPSHEEEGVGVGHAHPDGQVHPRHEVVHVPEAPVPDIGIAEFLAVSRAPPGIGPEDGVPFLGEGLEHVNARGPCE